MIKKLATILLLLSTCLQAELTTANILPQIAASLNAYPYLQATLTEIYSAAGDIDAAPEPDSLTANYYFARDDAYAEVQRDSRVEVITQNSYYLDLNGVKQLAGSLDDFLRSKMLPGFESYILRGLDAVTFNQLADGRLLITASAVASRDYDLAVLTVSHDILEKIEFYQTLTAEQLLLRRTLYLRYATQGGYWYLQRAAWNNGSPALMIREFTNVKYVSLGDIDLHNDGYDAPPGDGGDDFDEDDPSWPIGGQVKFEEGSKLTPFAAYGVAGEEVPGSSGALQLGYTDLSLPGINGLDLVIRRSYVSQQFLANPKPNSFSENPFNLRYRTKKFLDEYHLILPDGWGGWMGLGWQTSIGGELYVNEVDMFMLSGPYAGPPEMSKIQTMTVRNYTMQTADGYRADFGQEFEDDITGSEAEGAAFSFFTAPLALIARNTDFMDAKKMFELRDYLQRTDKLESPSNVLKSKDPRSKMKVSIEDGGETYVVYLPDGKKYYFRQKVFDKEAEYYTDSYNSAIFGVNRGFMGMQYRSKVYYLTQIADVNDNQIEIIYEKLFEEKSNKVSNKTLDYYAQIDSAAFVNTVLDLYTAIPASEIKDGMDTAKFMVSLNNMINDGTSAGGMAYSLFDEDARNNFTMSKFATGLLTGVVKKILVKFIASFLALIPPGIFLREIAAVGLAAIMSLSAEDTTYSYEARYEIQGHRPVQIVDTLKRRVDLHYRSGYDPNSIKDSQIEKISYKGPNGENNEIRYTYDPQRNVLTRVDYPAGEPIEYRYADVDQHLEDKGVADRGFLLTQVKHPSGFTSEYGYSWFQPNSDELSVSVPDGENKRWSYYRVVQKTHSDKDKGEVEPRVTRYEYSSGQPYQLYSNDPSSVSRRWYFKEHRIIDPLEQATRKVYYMGMLEYMFYPANIYVYNEYDMESRLLKLKRTVQSTSMHDVEYEYDGYGQMTKMIDHGYQAEKNNKDQRVTIMRYDNSKHEGEHAANVYNLVAEQYVEEPSKNTTNKYGHMKREYDDRGRMTKEQKYYTDTNYVTDEYAYDNYGNITTHTDPNGTQTSYTYQYNAYPQTQTTVADNKTFKTEAKYLQYTGSLFSQKDENGYETTYAYDKLNRKTKETHPDSTYIQTDYRDSERKTEVTDRKNRKTVYNYNPFGELKTITDPLNYTTTYQTDKLGRLETIRLADNREYRYGYDVLNRATRITYPDGSYAYKIYVDGSYPDPHLTTNPDGSTAILVYDENGHGMAYWKDAYGNLSKVVKGDDNSDLIYEYELNSLKSITSPPRYDPDDGLHTKPAKRYVTRFENDLLGRRTKKIQPDGTSEQFYYDANGNLTGHTNYENKITNYDYDGLNRITNEVYEDTQYNVYYEYDNGQNALTRLTKIQDKSGETEFKYNDLGLITEEKKTLDGQTYVTAYTYDNTGLLQNISYPQVQGQNIAVSYEYDGLDRIQTMKLNGSTLITNTYDNTGRLTQKQYGNGIKETYIYDAKDRLIEHEARKSDNTQIFLYKYTYDPAGNMTQRDITDDNALRRRDSYEYDYINQLTRMNVPGDRDIKYTYDELHNRTNMQHGFGHITYNYDEEGMNYLQSYEEDSGLAVQYAYDKQGNPTSKIYKDLRNGQSGRETAREVYVWNDRDELTQITGRVTESYTYDYRGLRHIKDSDGNVSKYVYLQNNQPALVYDVTSNSYQVFVYEGSKRIAKIALQAARPPTTEVLLNNYQGSVIAVIGEDESINYQKYLDPWGNLEMEIGNPSSNINFQYTDKELDTNTDLYYFQARYYDPKTNHFLNRDRVRLEDNPMNYFGVNPYLFVNNNPITNSDPDGLEPSPFEATNMLQYAYGVDGVELTGGWKAMGDSTNQFQRSLGNGKMEYAMAQRGTDPFSMHDWSENIKQPFGKSTDMTKFLGDARKFSLDHEKAEVTFLGHSKGGAEATAAAYSTGRNAIVFNSAWANVNAYVSDPQSPIVKSYAVRGEILGAERNMAPYMFGQKPGKEYMLPNQTPILGMPFMPASVRAAAGVYNHLMGPTQQAVQKDKNL